MEERIVGNNVVNISGEIVSDFKFNHEVFGEGFYVADLSTYRTSGYEDVIPIMVSDRLIDVTEDWKGQLVQIEGQFRSYNKEVDGKHRLILHVFAREFEVLDGRCDSNSISLDGYICKEPVYRVTPLKREITDLLVAVNRSYKKNDYIPCICWGRNARFADSLGIGAHVRIEGRIQSREYQKKVGEDEYETRVAYEVSVIKFESVEEES